MSIVDLFFLPSCQVEVCDGQTRIPNAISCSILLNGGTSSYLSPFVPQIARNYDFLSNNYMNNDVSQVKSAF